MRFLTDSHTFSTGPASVLGAFQFHLLYATGAVFACAGVEIRFGQPG
jgi:hypothetical protein